MSKEEEPLQKSKNKTRVKKSIVNVKAALTSWSVWLATISTLTTLISSIGFSIFFSKALNGFSEQINAFASIGNLGSFLIQTAVTIFVVAFILYLLFVHLASAKFFRNCLSCWGSKCMLFLSSIASQIFLVSWVLVVCGVSSITLVYFIFIGSIYSFCALVDTQCFNFNVLLPAIVSKLSNKKVDLTFCQEKKELLCNRENNMIWNFAIAFVLALITFAGALLVQNCVIYGFGKKHSPVKKEVEKIEMHEIN